MDMCAYMQVYFLDSNSRAFSTNAENPGSISPMKIMPCWSRFELSRYQIAHRV